MSEKLTPKLRNISSYNVWTVKTIKKDRTDDYILYSKIIIISVHTAFTDIKQIKLTCL